MVKAKSPCDCVDMCEHAPGPDPDRNYCKRLGRYAGDPMSVHGPIRLNLGAGGQALDGWVSVDLAGDPDITADVRKLPLPDEYADEIQAIHVFEHLYRWEALDTLIEWRRVLKTGGRLAIEVPDLLKCCANILGGAQDRAGVWGLWGDPQYRDPLMVHKWAYTPKELSHLMREAGFVKPKLKPVQWHKKYRDMRFEGVK